MYLVCSSPLTMILSKDDAFMILTTKIGLPTVDIITDCLTVENVFSIAIEFAHDSQLSSTLFGIGYAMIFFLVLSFILMLPQYFRVEKTRRQKLKALPFLLTSTWPQYRGMRLLWWSFIDENDEKCRAEKLDFEQEISHIGEYIRFQNRNFFLKNEY